MKWRSAAFFRRVRGARKWAAAPLAIVETTCRQSLPKGGATVQRLRQYEGPREAARPWVAVTLVLVTHRVCSATYSTGGAGDVYNWCSQVRQMSSWEPMLTSTMLYSWIVNSGLIR